MKSLTLKIEAGGFAICRFAVDEIPSWVKDEGFVSATRTAEEFSVVCDETSVPDGVKCDKGWRLFRLVGTQDLTETGILASILKPLGDAKISIFAISTFDTDYVLVKAAKLADAMNVLKAAGHTVEVK